MNANEPSPSPDQSESTSTSRMVVGGVLAAGVLAFGGNAASGIDQGEAQKTAEPTKSVEEAPADTLPSLNSIPSETTVTVSAPETSETTVAPVEAQPVDEAPAQEPVVSAPVTDASAPSAPEDSTATEEMPVLIGGSQIDESGDTTLLQNISSTGEVIPSAPTPEPETLQTPLEP